MKIIKILKNEMTTSRWQGGSTTELFIYPKNSSYALRDFQIRISSAVIEDSPSEFTRLNGFNRVLMPLDCKIRLIFEHEEGKMEVAVNPLDSTGFYGGTKTTCFGVGTDIGIMLSSGWDGKLFAADRDTYNCPCGFTGIYALCDGITVKAGKDYGLQQGDFLLINTDSCESFKLAMPSENSAIIAMVKKI